MLHWGMKISFIFSIAVLFSTFDIEIG